MTRGRRLSALAFLACTTLAAGCGGGSGVIPSGSSSHVLSQSSPSPGPAQDAAYVSDATAAGTWLVGQQLPDGAILYTSDEIEPYYGNLAATGLLKISNFAAVRAWMQWFVNHINATDVWGYGGTIYDYTYAGGTETSTNTADSVDSYNATFLTLARQLYDSGDATSRAFLVAIRPSLEQLGATVLKLQQSDGLTIALPNYPIAYLMDNAEAWRGLNDMSYLEQTAFANGALSTTYADAAAAMKSSIAGLWSSSRGMYAYAKAEPSGSLSYSTWSSWYPGATSQLFPVLEGVISPSSATATQIYASFNAAYPQWDQLDFPDTFPWSLVADTAAIMGDAARASVYAKTVQARYAAEGYPWPWYDAEAGWYMRALNELSATQTTTVADN